MKPILHRWHSLVWLPALVLCLLLSACRSGNREVAASLDRIEQVVGQHPDSALAELVRLDSLLDAGAVRIEGDRQMARYALLKTQTRDKNYIDDTNDSLILRAVRYYDEHGSKREQMLSHYYHGVIFRNAANFSQAYSSFLLAAKLATDYGDNTYAGLSYGNVSCLCRELYSGEDLYYAELSNQFHQATGDTARINWALMLKGIALNYQKRYSEAESIFDYLLHSDANESLRQEVLSYYIYQCVARHLYQRADSLIHLQQNPRYPVDFMNRAIVYEHNGQKEKSDSCMQFAGKMPSTATDKVYGLATLAILQNARGQHQEASQTLFQRAALQDSIVRSIKSASVSAIQRDYVQNQLDHKEEIMQERSLRYRLLLTFSLLLLLATYVILRQSLRHKNMLIQYYIDTASQLKQDLEASARESRTTIQHLFQKGMERIDKLSEELYNDNKPNKIKDKIYEELMKEVATFKDPAFVEKLSLTIDQNFDGLISKIRGCGLIAKEEDFRLLCFMIAGFSVKSICLFMDVIDRDVIYKRRKRLKKRICSSNEPFKDDLLQLLG